MANKLDVYDVRQFGEPGFREIPINGYKLREGIIHYGFKDEKFYIDRAKRLYVYEGVDRIILVSKKKDSLILERLAKKVQEKSRNEWKRVPNDTLIREDEHTFTGNIEIIDSEKKGKKGEVEIIQIDLVSNLFSTADYYLSKIDKNPEELPLKLVRILAGLYPNEWKEKPPGDSPHYDPRDILGVLIQMTSDKALIEYFEFFRAFFIKKNWNIEEIIKKLENFLGTSTNIDVSFVDLRLVLKIIHKSLLFNSISEIIGIKNEIEGYFRTILTVEPYLDMLFKKCLELFYFLEEFEETSDLQNKLYFLEKSRKKIREAETLVTDKFVEPFKKFYLDILKKWMDITFEEGEKLLNRPLLDARLQTRRAVWKEKLLVSLNIRNTGIGTAEKIEVVLHNSSDFEILGQNPQTIDILQRNRGVDKEFQIGPQVKESINLAFSISHGNSSPINISDTLIFVKEEEFRTIPNPYNFTRPAEDEMFFGRDDLFQWVEHNMKGPTIYQNVLMVGQRRAGKTSFLKQLQKRINSNHYCIFIDLELYPSLNDVDFFYEICQELHHAIPNNISSPNPQDFARKSYMAFGNYIRSLLSNIPSSKRIILIVDEFDKVERKIRESLFRPGFLLYFRGFFQHNPRISAIISGNFDFSELNSREWKEFFTLFNPKRVGVLDERSAIDLLTKPVKDLLQYDQYAMKKILDFSGRNPFYIQLICHTLINYINEKKKQNFVEAEDVSTVVLNEAKEKAELTLRLSWDELSRMEKNILFALSLDRIQFKESIGLDGLGKHLRKNNIKIEKWKLRNLLDSLEEKNILKKFGDPPFFYDFNILLLEEWIAEHGSFIGE
ncbi:MAG: hypothetical protein AYK19_08000 [Theionarchaea archaeon DG-70-1]|nr:MAG: hypothetical protein AYK19_08000 [Theionarchaea archaeon DG-70-1]